MRGRAGVNSICCHAVLLVLLAQWTSVRAWAQQPTAALAAAPRADDYQAPASPGPLQPLLPQAARRAQPQLQTLPPSAPQAPPALQGHSPLAGGAGQGTGQVMSRLPAVDPTPLAPPRPEAPARTGVTARPPVPTGAVSSARPETIGRSAAAGGPRRPAGVAPASYQDEMPAEPGQEAADRHVPESPPSAAANAQALQLLINGQEPALQGAWSLPQVEATTFNFNPVLRRSLARIESARGDAQQAGLYPNPSFDTNNPEVFAGPATQYNVGFQQTIVTKGKLRLDRAAANEVVRQKEHGLTQDRFEMLLNVRQQFYTVLAAQRRREMLSQIRDIAAASVRAAEARRNAGEVSQFEVVLLQTELARTEIALQTAETMLAAERRQLSAIMGRPDLSIPQVTGQLTFGFPNYDENYLREFVVSQNAQVQVARREIERNQILLRRARVEPYPNLHGGPAFANNLSSAPGTQQFWFNIQFDIPLWNRNQGNIRSTEADVADAIASLGVLQNDLLRQVEEVLGRYRAARLAEERIRTQVLPSALRAQQLVKVGFKNGVLDISTFLQAQRGLSDAMLSYIDSLENIWTTAAEIASLLQLNRFP